ncbi:MAG: hypothetical protein WCA91_01660 [Candidatus Acidiferrales bacterium]
MSDTLGAEYGKRRGAQIIVAASGTNDPHGSAYKFLGNRALDARNYFDAGPVPPLERNEFGCELLGPIRPNKVFLFFGDYGGFRQRLGLSDVTLVPDNDARNGFVPRSDGALQNVGIAPGVTPLFSLEETLPNGRDARRLLGWRWSTF